MSEFLNWKAVELLQEILENVKEIRKCVCRPKRFAVLMFYNYSAKGARMPATIQVGQTATAVLHEFESGTEVPPIGPVTYSSSDPTVATVDPSSGVCTGVAAGSCAITGSDSGNGLSASDSLTVTSVVLRTATLVITPNTPTAVKK